MATERTWGASFATAGTTLAAALVLLGCTNSATGAGSGPCYDEPPFDPGSMDRVDCDEARFELVGTGELERSGLATWPGRLALATEVYDVCLEAAEQHVGAPLPELGLDVWFRHPDEAAWSEGQRGYLCAVEDIEGDALRSAGAVAP